MPTVSLRLSDSEHARLLEWAFGSRRSLQREIVFRLFDVNGLAEGGGGVVVGVTRADGSEAGSNPAVSAPLSASPSARPVTGLVVRAHMKKSRPAVECSSRVFSGGVCVECGAEETA